MRYSGGKGKIAAKLAGVLLRLPHSNIIEPFCGALSMTVQLQPSLASDASQPIVTLVNAVRGGWHPPTEISEQLYKDCAAQKTATDNPLIAFVGHCTFGGKWYGGLARGHKRQWEPVRAAAETLVRRVLACPNTVFQHTDYREVKIPDGALVYCDPPYAGTTNGYAVSGFNHGDFWDWARKHSVSAHVVVSEYAAPPDFREIFSLDCATNVRRLDTNHRQEKLFVYGK
jgi:DNA adenine methylase